jgi:hypothetical protein
MERPDTREFDFDCHAEVVADRPRLVVDCLTILRAYHVADRPQPLTPMGGFDDWEWVRGALVWLECSDPADTRSGILDSDPRKDELLDVMRLWTSTLGDAAIDVGAFGKRVDEPSHALKQKLIEVACRQDTWNAKSIGWWLRRNKDRVIGERCFKYEDRLWRLVGVQPVKQQGQEDEF